METLQNAVVVVGFFGLLVRAFGMKIKHQPRVSAAKGTRKPKKKAKRIQPKKTKEKKGQILSKANKPSEPAKMHKPDAAEIWRVEEMFRKGRD